MERFSWSTPSAQGISCVYGITPSPPKLPSPKRSRLRATPSQESAEIRATQSDSSIVSSSSDKAADLKPKVSGAWLDGTVVKDGEASVRSQSPKRPHSSPTPSLHRRSSGRLSTRHSLDGVSMETDTAVAKATWLLKLNIFNIFGDVLLFDRYDTLFVDSSEFLKVCFLFSREYNSQNLFSFVVYCWFIVTCKARLFARDFYFYFWDIIFFSFRNWNLP